MKNHWLGSAKKKKILSKIDDIAMEVWSEDGTFGDLYIQLSREQKNFLMSMVLSDFVFVPGEEKIYLELVVAN
jgi:hypothetical protein